MSIVIPEGFAQIRYGWQLTGSTRPMYCTIGCSVAGAADAQELANEMDTAWLSTIGTPANLVAGATVLPTYVQARFDAGPPSIASAGVPVPTTSAGGAPPPNVALMVKKLTALGGRRFRGRMFLPAVFTNEIYVSTAGVIDNAQILVLQPKLNAFKAAVEAYGRSLYLLHSEPEVGFILPTALSALVLDPLVATQRSRLR